MTRLRLTIAILGLAVAAALGIAGAAFLRANEAPPVPNGAAP